MKVVVAFSFALASLACAATSGLQAPHLRLGANVVPGRYRIDVTVVPGSDSFQGRAEIDVNIHDATRFIWLNATSLKIASATFAAGGATISPELTAEEHGFVGLRFPNPVSGAGTLRFEYEGAISKKSSAGVFALEEDGNWYVYTQFEPTDARRAFPCFDQPSFKTPWRITMHVPASAMALANSPVESESPESGGMKAVRFRESKPLPSYLVAFAAGRFDAVPAGHVGDTPLRIITPHGHAAEAQYAAEAIPQLLALEVKYFGRPYPYDKLDSIAMPVSNFAMENAGLITYGQSTLLGNPGADTISRQREMAIVAAHEMAHQWFGDLVTMDWWNDIWLNEAFASWMEEKITGEWKPDWKMDVEAVESRLTAMRADSLVSARRITQPIESEGDIANAFDDITYQKGDAVIRMFEHFVGEQPFRRGVQLYLKRYEWHTATTPEFLAAVGEGSGRDVAPAFGTFVDQTGVPMVTISLDCTGAKPRLDLSQKRTQPIGAPAAAPETWEIPVCVRYEDASGMHSQCEPMTAENARQELHEARSCPAWLLGNDGGAGYYRVRYDGNLLSELLADGGKKLSTAERVSELANMDALVGTGDVAPAKALALVPEFSRDPDWQVVRTARSTAAIVKGHETPADLLPKAELYIRDVFAARAVALGWTERPGESDDTRLLREQLVPFVAGNGGDRALADGANKLARQWLKTGAGTQPDMLTSVLTTAAEYGDQDLFDALRQRALREKDPSVRQKLLNALGRFRDPRIAQESLQLLLSGDFDTRQAFFPLLFGPLSYRETEALPFDFVRHNLDALMPRLPREVGEDFAADLPATGRAFCDAERRAEVANFFGERVKSYSGGERNLQNTLERIDVCIARKAALGPSVAEFLRGRNAGH